MSNLIKAQIEDGLVAWLELITPDMKPFVADQNAPQTPDSVLYCAIRVQGMEKIGRDERRAPSDAGISTVRGNREFMAYLTAYREGAFDAICALRDSLGLTSVHDLFVSKGFVPVDSEPVQNITEREQQSMVEGASLDVRFRLGVELEDDVGLIETVEGEATIIKRADDLQAEGDDVEAGEDTLQIGESYKQTFITET